MIQLGEWLKQIILIVIMAVFADLLLPTKAMQKYVRAVMGLVVIATILQPIVPFFQRDWADKLAQAAANEFVSTNQTSSGSSANNPSSPGLSSYAKDLQQQQSTAADNYVEQELTADIVSQFHCTVTQLVVHGTTRGSQATNVSAVIQTFNQGQLTAIRNFIATTLKIPNTQVNVSSA